jgi:hypothetical protein
MTEQAQETSDRPDELDEWRARFEDVVHSKSWRLTEPLRALKRRFKR